MISGNTGVSEADSPMNGGPALFSAPEYMRVNHLVEQGMCAARLTELRRQRDVAGIACTTGVQDST
jgi:hypothetical protein